LPQALHVAEPQPVYASLPPAVVDCSVLAALLWAEPTHDDARARIAARSLHAPSLLGYELANVARSKWRAGVPEALVRHGLAAFDEQRVTLHEMEATAVFEAAARHGLSAYDAAYLVLAGALRAPLLTFDKRLADAAAQALGRAGAPPS
jgi:predicted nucleic acid-binding protein